MIKSLVVKGLWGRYDYDLQFNEDVNIFTGSNGTGKTTLLKMLWYVYSGNYEQLATEISFKKLVIVNDTNTVEIDRSQVESRDEFGVFIEQVIRITSTNILNQKSISFETTDKRGRIKASFERFLKRYVGASYFFPTFRRLEGGFSLEESTDLINALADLTTRMSKDKHRFIGSSNSEDIKALINEISSDIRLKQEVINAEFMSFVSQNVTGSQLPRFTEELRKKVEEKENAEALVKEPIDNLSKYIDQFFWEKSVKISDSFKLGSHENEISIENLSAGEKNLLSFLVYATSLKEGIMFIDEPELNLHIEWQRELVATLLDIAPNVQLFMASHSPGIYADYPDKAPWFDKLVISPKLEKPAVIA